MTFDVKKQGIPGFIAMGSAVLALISLFIPWISVDLGFLGKKSELGVKDCWTIIYFIICWGIPVFTFVVSKAANSAVAVLGGIIAAVFGFFSAMFRYTGTDMLGKTINFSGAGTWIFMIAALGLIAAGVLAAKDKGNIVDMLVADAKDVKNIFKM